MQSLEAVTQRLSAWLPSLACPSGHALRGRSRSQAQWDAEGTCPTRKPRSGPGSAH